MNHLCVSTRLNALAAECRGAGLSAQLQASYSQQAVVEGFLEDCEPLLGMIAQANERRRHVWRVMEAMGGPLEGTPTAWGMFGEE